MTAGLLAPTPQARLVLAALGGGGGCATLVADASPYCCGKATAATVVSKPGSLIYPDGTLGTCAPWRVCRDHGLWIEAQYRQLRAAEGDDSVNVRLFPEVVWDAA